MLNLIRIYFQVSLIDWRKFSCCWMFNLPIPNKNVELKTFRILIEVNKWLLCEWKLNWKNWAFFERFISGFSLMCRCAQGWGKFVLKNWVCVLAMNFPRIFTSFFQVFLDAQKSQVALKSTWLFIFHSSFLLPLLTSWKFKQLVEGKA